MKPSTRAASPAKQITDAIIARLESGVSPWRRTWAPHGLQRVAGADDELVDAGAFAQADGDGVGVLEGGEIGAAGVEDHRL